MTNGWKHSGAHTKNFHNKRKAIEWLLLSSDVISEKFPLEAAQMCVRVVYA